MAPPIVIFKKENLPSFLAAGVILAGLKRVNPVMIAWGQKDPLPDTRDRALILIEPTQEIIGTIELSLHAAILSTTPKTIGLNLAKIPTICHININQKATAIQLAWLHVFAGTPFPPFLKALEDQLLGLNAIPNSQDILSIVKKDRTVVNEDLTAYVDKFYKYFNGPQCDDINQLIIKNQMMNDLARDMVNSIIARNTKKITLGGHTVPIVNIPSEFSDLAGEMLSANAPFAMTYEERLTENKRVYVLYSREDGVDVGAIARKCKGNGNTQYATFTGDLNISISSLTF